MKQKLISLASHAYLKIGRVPRLVVMTFHRVGGKQPITPAHIRHHMDFLARHYEMIVPSQMIDWIACPTRPSELCTNLAAGRLFGSLRMGHCWL